MKHLLAMVMGLLVGGCAAQGEGVVTQFDAVAAKPAAITGPAPVQAEAAAEAPAEPKLVPMTKRDAPLVDKQKALQENPKLVEVENRINASDPLTAAAQSYFTIGSKAQVLAMQHSIKIHQAQYEKWPTFAEFSDMIRQSNVKLNGLYAYQMYAYDDATGDLCILEDRAEMKRQYEAAGREYPHDE